MEQLEPPPAFIAYRQQMWDNLKKEYDEWVKGQPPQSILITMPDGKKFEGLSWRTTPFEVAKSIRFIVVSILYLLIVLVLIVYYYY